MEHRPVLAKLWHRTLFEDGRQCKIDKFDMDDMAPLDKDKLREAVYRGLSLLEGLRSTLRRRRMR